MNDNKRSAHTHRETPQRSKEPGETMKELTEKDNIPPQRPELALMNARFPQLDDHSRKALGEYVLRHPEGWETGDPTVWTKSLFALAAIRDELDRKGRKEPAKKAEEGLKECTIDYFMSLWEAVPDSVLRELKLTLQLMKSDPYKFTAELRDALKKKDFPEFKCQGIVRRGCDYCLELLEEMERKGGCPFPLPSRARNTDSSAAAPRSRPNSPSGAVRSRPSSPSGAVRSRPSSPSGAVRSRPSSPSVAVRGRSGSTSSTTASRR